METEVLEPSISPVGGKAPEKPNHCPFGCTIEKLDDRGYCKHLIGFTNDRKHVELIMEQVDRHGNKTGHKMVSCKERCLVQEGDKCVNPLLHAKTKDGPYTYLQWSSWRVYRPTPASKAKAG